MLCVFRFIKLGHQPFDGVAMWGFNAPEWMFSTFAAMMAGGMAGGLYPTDTPETAAFKVAHSGVTWPWREGIRFCLKNGGKEIRCWKNYGVMTRYDLSISFSRESRQWSGIAVRTTVV